MTLRTSEKQRLDQWLWRARFFKSRGLAARLCRSQKIQVDGQRPARASACIRPGNVLTFPQGREVRLIRVLELAKRRGPAPEARALYLDLAPPETGKKRRSGPDRTAVREPGSGRPTKRQRRALEKLRNNDSDMGSSF